MTTLYLLLIPPLLAALLSWGLRRMSFLGITAVVATTLELAAALRLAYEASREVVFTTPVFVVDALSAVVLLTVAVIGFFTSFYSIGYLQEEMAKGIIGMRRARQYFTLVHLFLFAMFFATVTTAPILMWIAIEATTLATAFLVSFYNKRSAIEAAWKYLILNSVGLLLGFLGTLLYFTTIQSSASLITWDTLKETAPLLNPAIAKVSFILVLVGYGTKIGLAPMHTWKPDAYSKAPTPVVALFSGALLNVALLSLLRFKGITDIALQSSFTEHLLIGFGLFTILLSGLLMFTQWNYKRMLAYSSIEHAGIMVFGFGLGGIASFAAILHMLYHSLAKTALFFSAGNIFLKYSSTRIDRVRGLWKTLPTTTVLLFIGFVAVVGLPPFGMFYTELYIVLVGVGSHPYLTAAVVFALALVFVGLLRQLTRMSFGEAPEGVRTGEASYFTTIPVIVLVVILGILSVYLPDDLRTLAVTAANAL